MAVFQKAPTTAVTNFTGLGHSRLKLEVHFRPQTLARVVAVCNKAGLVGWGTCVDPE